MWTGTERGGDLGPCSSSEPRVASVQSRCTASRICSLTTAVPSGELLYRVSAARPAKSEPHEARARRTSLRFPSALRDPLNPTPHDCWRRVQVRTAVCKASQYLEPLTRSPAQLSLQSAGFASPDPRSAETTSCRRGHRRVWTRQEDSRD